MHFNTSSFLSLCKGIEDISQPLLLLLESNYFGYRIIYKDGKCFDVSSLPAWLERRYLMGYDKLGLNHSTKSIKSQYIIWDCLSQKESSSTKALQDASECFDLSHSFQIIKRYDDYTECFNICSSHKKNNASETYLLNIEPIENFLIYFRKKINILNKNNLFDNFLFNLNKYDIENSSTLNDKNIINFYRSIFEKNLSCNNIKEKILSHLSRREIDCLILLGERKMTKEMAKILSLSPRTIEHYIENLKNKIGVSYRSEIREWIEDVGFLYTLKSVAPNIIREIQNKFIK